MIHGFRGPLDRSHNSWMGSAAAYVALHGTRDVGGGWVGVGAQERNSRHDHPRCAVGALHRRLFKKGLLQRMQMVTLGKAFNRRNLLLAYGAHRGDTGPAGTAIDQDRTGAALSLSTPVLASRQIKLIAQDAQ